MLFVAPELDDAERHVLGQIDDLKGNLRFRLTEPRRWYDSLRRVSLARAIQGSNSIEGYEAGIDDVVDVVAGEEPLDVNEETRLALIGYRNAMTYVLQMAEDPDFEYNTQLIKSLHYIMTNYALANRPGRWRASSVYVRKEETGEIVHEGVDLDQVSILMEDLMAALNTQSNEPGIIRAAMAHLNLVMIHPFRDGNGRMARCLQSLVLARNGVLSPVFMSVEEYLGRNKPAYYDVLGLVGGGSWQPDRDSRPWLRFTLTAHLRQARTILQRVKESERMWVELEQTAHDLKLPDRSVTALFDAMIGLRVRNATYRAYFDDTTDAITEATASRDLQKLVQADLLEARGERRGRQYVARPALAAVRHRVVQARTPRDDTDPFAAAG